MIKSWVGGAVSMGLFVAFVVGLRLYQDIFHPEMIEADRAASR